MRWRPLPLLLSSLMLLGCGDDAEGARGPASQASPPREPAPEEPRGVEDPAPSPVAPPRGPERPDDCGPVRCEGPAASLSALTSQMVEVARRLAADEAGGEDGSAGDRLPDDGRVSIVHEPAQGPAERLAVVTFLVQQIGTRHGNWATYGFLGVRAGGAWYGCNVGGGVPAGWSMDVELAEPELRQLLPGGPPEIVVRVAQTEATTAGGVENGARAESVFVCGVEEERPLCFGEIPVGVTTWSRGRECADVGDESTCRNVDERASQTLSLSLEPPGRVVLQPSGGALDSPELAPFPGEYPLRELRCALRDRSRERAR